MLLPFSFSFTLHQDSFNEIHLFSLWDSSNIPSHYTINNGKVRILRLLLLNQNYGFSNGFHNTNFKVYSSLTIDKHCILPSFVIQLLFIFFCSFIWFKHLGLQSCSMPARLIRGFGAGAFNQTPESFPLCCSVTYTRTLRWCKNRGIHG